MSSEEQFAVVVAVVLAANIGGLLLLNWASKWRRGDKDKEEKP